MSVNGVTSTSYLDYAKRVGRIYLHTTFGTGADEFMTSMEKSIFKNRPKDAAWYQLYKGADWSDFWTKFKKAFHEVEKHEEKIRKANGGSYAKSFWKQISSTPKLFKDEWELGGKVAKKAGKSILAGKCGGAMKALTKRMPLIGGLIALAYQIPNIVNAFSADGKDEKTGVVDPSKAGGFATGLLETGKAIVKVGLDTVGFMVGQALIPIPLVGGIIGSFAASFLGEKILGKSFSQKQDEAAGKKQILPTFTPYTAQSTGMPHFNGNYDFVAPKSKYSNYELYRMEQYLSSGRGLDCSS